MANTADPGLPSVAQGRPVPASQGSDPEDNQGAVSAHIQQLLADSSISTEVLESAVEIGTQILGGLAVPLDDAVSLLPDAAPWLKSVTGLEARAKPPRTVVGVVGNTGAGKSSVINALLDEERLVTRTDSD